MFKTKRIVSITALVFMLLGMMVVFQGDEAEADHSSWSCALKSHASFGSIEMRLTYSHTTTKKTTCIDCAGGFATTHDVRVYDAEIRTRDRWIHRLPFHKWVFCHYHHGPWTAASPIESVVRCNNPLGVT